MTTESREFHSTTSTSTRTSFCGEDARSRFPSTQLLQRKAIKEPKRKTINVFYGQLWVAWQPFSALSCLVWWLRQSIRCYDKSLWLWRWIVRSDPKNREHLKHLRSATFMALLLKSFYSTKVSRDVIRKLRNSIEGAVDFQLLSRNSPATSREPRRCHKKFISRHNDNHKAVNRKFFCHRWSSYQNARMCCEKISTAVKI